MPVRKKIPEKGVPQQAELPPEIEATEQRSDLRTKLELINATEGVIGYILRAQTSAVVDVKDHDKIIEYAFLSTLMLESAECLSQAFALGKVSNVVLTGNNLKMLLLNIGEQSVSIFMEIHVNHESICRELF